MNSKKRRSFSSRLKHNKAIVIPLIILILALLCALFAKQLAPCDPFAIDFANSLSGPTLQHFLGCDALGRDLLSRIIYGARTSLLIAFSSVFIGGCAGIFLGLVGGYIGGIFDALIMRITDVLLSVPQIVLAMAIGAVLEKSILNIIIALSVSILPSFIRMARSEVLSVKELDYVVAGVVSGYSKLRIAFVHILPNCIAPIIVTAALSMGNAIIAESSLNYLGIGIDSSIPAWGSMVSENFPYLSSAPMLSIAPGLAIVAVVFSFNMLGMGVRDLLSPHGNKNKQ